MKKFFMKVVKEKYWHVCLVYDREWIECRMLETAFDKPLP
jgi:hypothetical protein